MRFYCTVQFCTEKLLGCQHIETRAILLLLLLLFFFFGGGGGGGEGFTSH